MTERTFRDRLHEKLLQSSVFYASSEREHQQSYLDDFVEEYLEKNIDQVLAHGLEFLDSMQRVGSSPEGGDDGWSW
ncbi:MAG: hypothetical protein FJ125_07895 [Deltaproteobacteria bacterium]|nr:hypothetical protein [Deltaproteobacteria bacterium]